MAPRDGVTIISFSPGDDLVELARSPEKRRPVVYRNPKDAPRGTPAETQTGPSNTFDSLTSIDHDALPTGIEEEEDASGEAMPKVDTTFDPSLKIAEDKLKAGEKIRDMYRRRKGKKRLDRFFLSCYSLWRRNPTWSNDYRDICLWRFPYILQAIKRLEKLRAARDRARDEFSRIHQSESEYWSERTTHAS
jgi:hypothetical protein